MTTKPATIDEYISSFSPEIQCILEQIRRTIRSAAPDAEEVISYQMPAFKQQGILLYFAAWKNHIGLYPPISDHPELEVQIAKYAGPKGNLQFPIDEPIPYHLIEQITLHRLHQDAEHAVAKKLKSKSKRG